MSLAGNRTDSLLPSLLATPSFSGPDLDVLHLRLPFGSDSFDSMIEAFCSLNYCTEGYCDIEECERQYMEENHCYTRALSGKNQPHNCGSAPK